MRILRASIFGFGKWVDYSLDFPEEGPVIIYGENESGKSTFHQFILFMLFGMPPKQRKFYQPKTSSKFGGQLVVTDPEIGEFTIERVDNKNNAQATCYTKAGEVYDEEWLKDRLHQMNEKTFQAIFSFSALDLNAIKHMDEEDLGEVLLSIGLTGSGSIYQVEKQLDARLAEMFLPNGKRPEINQQLQVLHELADKLTTDKMSEASYREKILASEELSLQLDKLQKEISAKTRQTNFISKQRSTLPVIQEYQYLATKQKDYLEVNHFPENGIARFEKIKEEQRPIESEYTVLENNAVKAKATIEALEREQLEVELLEEVSSKVQAIEESFEIQDKIDELQKERAEIKRRINEEVHDLQLNIEQTELNELSLPFYVEETWKQLKMDKEQLNLEKTQLQSESNSLQEEQRYYQNELSEIEKDLLAEEEVNIIKAKLAKHREHGQLQQLHEASILKQKNFKKEKESKEKLSKTVLFGSLLLAVISIGLAFLIDENILYGVGILILILGIVQFITTKQNHNQMEEMLQIPISMKEHEQLSVTEIASYEKQLNMHEDRLNEINRIEAILQEQTVKEIQWEEKERSYKERQARYERVVDEQVTLYPFLTSIDVSYWDEYYGRLKNLVKAQQSYQQIDSEKELLTADLQTKENDVFNFMETKFPENEISEPAAIKKFLVGIQENELEMERRRNHLEESLQDTKGNMEDLLKRLSIYNDEITALFNIANVTTEEAFYQLANYTEEKAQLEVALETNKQQLDATFPEQSWSAFIEEHLDALELEQTQEQLENEIQAMEQEREGHRSSLAQLHVELSQLESSDAYSEKMHHFEMEKEKLNQLSRKWATLKIEKEVLSETKQKYRAKYLSKVMEETTIFLQTITDGNYVSVHAPEDRDTFWVVSQDGIRYDVSELSQGTMNQLYVSLRLAISKVMTEDYKLPFIVDDAFVHFDEVRVKKMMQTLQDIAGNQQMIMFTCKNDIRTAGKQLDIEMIAL